MSNQLIIDPLPHGASGALDSWGSRKLQEHHLSRSAIVYVRQSSPHQVREHVESAVRQYALVERAVQIGWARALVEVIDEDQGQSGRSAENRLGFQRLLAEVSLDHVGIVLGIEMSRLARSNRDWHQLIELCAIFRTLLADQDGLYDPTDYNDRLLLGLKGTMSEAELHILKGRMHQALLSKAKRGDLYILPPLGYVKLPSGEFALDPDEQAQSVMRLIFDEFDRLGSIRRVLFYLQEHDIKLPFRPHSGPNVGELEWRRAKATVIDRVLTHPLYAGVYRYGHRQTDARLKKAGRAGSGRRVVKPQQYHALIPNRCPAYITLERYERNKRRIRENRTQPDTKGPPREGPALLGGIVFCGRCGRRMTPHYPGVKTQFRYACSTGKSDCDLPRCQNLSGQALDDLVAEKILQALAPAALELSLLAADDLEQERQRLDKHWQQRLERSRYECDRAQRRHQAVEPENRLVARELERQWETTLHELRDLEQQYARFRQAHSATLSNEERQLVRALAEDLPAVWKSPTTSPGDRQRIIRLLVERVVITMQGSTERVDVSLHWSGGFNSQHELVRTVGRYEQLADYERLLTRVEQLGQQGLTAAEIAECLNQEGFRPARRAKKFCKWMVSQLFQRLRRERPTTQRASNRVRLKEHEWFLTDLAAHLEIPKSSLFKWFKRGWLRVDGQLAGYSGRLICWADADELERLRRLRQTKFGWWAPPPEELTTPKAAVPDLPNKLR
jgi:DNA invertase Pin-like site-specific DNA recombinase